MVDYKMDKQPGGSVKESPEECSIGDWVLATGSNIEVQWLDEKKAKTGELELDYESVPGRTDTFRRAESFGDQGDVWVRVK